MRITGKHMMGALFALITLGAVSSLAAFPSSSWLRNLLRNHTVIYVHGMKFKDYSYCQGKSTCKGAWDQQRSSSLIKIVHTGWDGRMDPGVFRRGRGSYQLLDNLNKYCRRDQGKSCQIVCGSMGCYTASLTISKYNRNQRYNVTHSISLAAADGGSPIASLAKGLITKVASGLGIPGVLLSEALTKRHFSIINAARPSRARAAFDHNRNNGTQFYHKATYIPPLINTGGLIRVFDRSDLVVTYSSACAYREMRKFRKCGGERIRVGWRICMPGRWGRSCRRRNFRDVKPWTGHHASPSFGSGGKSGKIHGFFSKKGGQYHSQR